MGLKRESFFSLVIEMNGKIFDNSYEGKSYIDVLKALNRFEVDFKDEFAAAKEIIANVYDVTRLKQWCDGEYRWNITKEDINLYKKIVLKNELVGNIKFDITSEINKDIKLVSTR